MKIIFFIKNSVFCYILSMKDYVCPRCNCSDEKYIGLLNGKYYCRRCISSSGTQCDLNYNVIEGKCYLDYSLSDDQMRISNALIDNFKEGKNAIIHAVTGAGKTELVFGLIEYCLNKHLHVGFAVPRVDIVRELYDRFCVAFKDNKICSVYGEHCLELNGDIIVLTTHQLYRYEGYFDLLILDEIDAFPYRKNEMLHQFFKKSIRGNYVLMSATLSDNDIKEMNDNGGTVFKLFKRYHGKKLVVPKYIKESVFPRFQILLTLKKFITSNKPVFIFAPTISIVENLGIFLRIFFRCGMYVSSKSQHRKEIIERFKQGHYKYLVTTSILERGVTVKNLQVMVYQADSDIYDKSTLVQIAGRVGRKKDASGGEVIFYGKEKTRDISDSIEEIQRFNKEAGL